METLRILAESYSEMRSGIWSGRGETMWACRLARALAAKGHEVHVIGYSEGRPWRKNTSTGDYVDVRGMDDSAYDSLPNKKNPLIREDDGVMLWDRKELPKVISTKSSGYGPFDVLFHQTIERDRWDTKAFGKVLIGSFSWRAGHYDTPSWNRKENEIFVLPHRTTDAAGIIEGRDFKWLPLPMGSIDINGFERQGVAFTAKECYRPRYDPMLLSTVERWAAAPRAIKDDGFKVTVFGVENDARPVFAGLDCFPELEPPEFFAKLAQHSIAVPLHYSGSIVDCARLGVLPVLCMNGGVGCVDRGTLTALSRGKSTFETTSEEAYLRMKGLLTNPDAYEAEASLLRASLNEYRDVNAVRRFEHIVSA